MIKTHPLLVEMREAVVREPGCDTVRLAYADALDEVGGPANQCYAKFIRLCIKNEAEHGPGWAIATKLRNDALWVGKRLEKYARLWVKTTCGPQYFWGHSTLGLAWTDKNGPYAPATFNFRRGFLSSCHASWQGWEFWSQHICKDEPISDVTLSRMPPFPMTKAHLIEEKNRTESIRSLTLEWLQAKWPQITKWELPK